MTRVTNKIEVITTKVQVSPAVNAGFVEWQSKLDSAIAACAGFVSLEIVSPLTASDHTWLIIQRFKNSESFNQWLQSEEWQTLNDELKKIVGVGSIGIEEEKSDTTGPQGGVTEVFVTQISPGMEMAYRHWFAKIHKLEAGFPGFRRVYLQSPSPGQGHNWLTLLQFDNQQNLDRWLASPEREQMIQESAHLVSSLESHRVISPYAGWFASVTQQSDIPAVWKQTMIVLLVLFPIVVLELKYLSLLTAGMNSTLATFIGNAISVTLIAWPCMPVAIYFLNWWLSPASSNKRVWTVLGTIFVLFLYLIEIVIFWNFLSN